MQRKNYTEGTCFSVPIRDKPYAIGVVARESSLHGVIAAYFFKTQLTSPPTDLDLSELDPGQAVLVCRVGDLGLANGDWIVIGPLSRWNRKSWPIPKFVRNEPLSGRNWLTEYSDSDPSIVVSEELVDAQVASAYERDVLSGYKAVEKKLARIL